MSLSQVQAAVAIVMTLIVSWSALLTATALVLPSHAGRAEQVLEAEPKRCFLRGLAMVVLLVIGFFALAVGAPLVKVAGILVLLFLGAVVTLGAAGLAHLMGKRIAEMSGAKTSFGALVRGSFVYSFAMLFPLIGWYLFLPISMVFAFGAGITILWPRRRHITTPPVSAFEGSGAA